MLALFLITLYSVVNAREHRLFPNSDIPTSGTLELRCDTSSSQSLVISFYRTPFPAPRATATFIQPHLIGQRPIHANVVVLYSDNGQFARINGSYSELGFHYFDISESYYGTVVGRSTNTGQCFLWRPCERHWKSAASKYLLKCFFFL